MFSGALVALLPFLGFPNSWDKFMFLGLGLFVIALGIMVRRRKGTTVSRAHMKDRAFVEHTPDHFHDAS